MFYALFRQHNTANGMARMNRICLSNDQYCTKTIGIAHSTLVLVLVGGVRSRAKRSTIGIAQKVELMVWVFQKCPNVECVFSYTFT